MKYAIIRDGIVENVIEMEPGADWLPPENTTLMAADRASPGWRLIDNELVDPAPPAIAVELPITVSRLRFKLELAARDMLPKVEEAVKAAGSTPLLYWQEATEFESDHPLVQQIGAGLGLSPADIRAMFESAAARDA